ncbi:unnamed protein product [Rhizopus stolonifer]
MNQTSGTDTSTKPITIDVAPRQHRQSLESGLSPTYYTSEGIIQLNSKFTDNLGSPVFNDQSRVFFTHNHECSCRGSGVGCDCTKTCSC